MSQHGRWRVAAPLVLAVALAVPAPSAAAGSVHSAATPRAAAGPHWTLVGSPHVAGQNERPLAVVAPAPGDVWAIGYHYEVVGGAAEFRTLAEHFDGSRFVTVPTPDRETAPARDFLNGAAAPAPDDIWAVGTSVGAPDRTLIEHWDGARWTITASPDPGAVSDDLEAAAASAPTDVWAVGALVRSGHFYQAPMALHFDGATWRPVHVPNPPGCTGNSYLTAVAALDARSAWATGWCGSGGSAPERGYVLHWDGAAWTLATVIPQTVAPDSETYGIAATSDSDVWVVGQFETANGASAPLIYRFTGRCWQLQPAPAGGQTLAAVTAARSGVWAVGAGTSPQPPFAGPTAIRRTAAGWVDRPVPVDFGRLTGVVADPDGVVWTVGSQILPDGEDTALIAHR